MLLRLIQVIKKLLICIVKNNLMKYVKNKIRFSIDKQKRNNFFYIYRIFDELNIQLFKQFRANLYLHITFKDSLSDLSKSVLFSGN